MSEKLQRIFIIDDEKREEYADDLRTLFKDVEVEAFTGIEGVLTALEDGRYPQAVFLDSTFGDWGDEYPDWATDNANSILSWFQDNVPEEMPADFIFQSEDPGRSKKCAETIGTRTDTNITHCDKLELKLSISLMKGLKPEDGNAGSTAFRKFLKETTGISLPMTKEEVVEQGIRLNSYDKHDVIKFAKEGSLDLDKALSLLRSQSVSSAANDLRPRAIVTDKLDLKSTFQQAAGNTAKGHAAFSIDDVNTLAEDGGKAILYLEEYDPDIIPHLGKVAGVVLLDNNSSGHIRSILNSHGVAGALGTSPIDKIHPYMRTPDGEKITSGKVIEGQGSDRAFFDYESALDKIGNDHLAKHCSENEEAEQAPPLTVDIKELTPDMTIKFGDPVTMDIINQNDRPNIYNTHLDISESKNGAHKWLPEVVKLLEEWHQKNEVIPLEFKAIVDSAEQNYDGADGIGLLRTKHFILETEIQSNAYRKALLEQDESAFKILRTEFQKTLVEDTFYNAQDYEPIRIRLVDLPLGELFSKEESAQIGNKYGEVSIRGAQLGMALPKLYETQLHAIFSAAREAENNKAIEKGINPSDVTGPQIEIMISNTRTAKEIEFFGEMAERIAAEHDYSFDDYRFGSMLETKSAGRDIENIAPYCDFLSIGSNDGSSEVLEYERHDFDKRNEIMKDFGKKYDPAITLYPPVVEWIEDVVDRARDANPDLQVDLCGDHAADSDSLNALRHVGLDGVSVTPNNQNLIGLKIQYGYETFDQHQEKNLELAINLTVEL